MKMRLVLLLIISVFASEEKEKEILVKIEDDEYAKIKSPEYIGVSYRRRDATWCAHRWSKNDHKSVCNGTYKDAETAAHASDTLARKLIANGENDHKLNFPDDNTEVHPKGKTSDYIGVSYNKKDEMWRAKRYSKKENKTVHNGSYKKEETTARASDTVARNLIANGEIGYKLNFPDDDTEVYAKTKSSDYIGVTYHKKNETWHTQRWSKHEKKYIHNGAYKDEETAAQASDTLARKLIANGEKGHKPNFSNEENQSNKRKRPKDFQTSQPFGISLDKVESEENEDNE